MATGGAGFTRRFTPPFPSQSVIQAIEGVVILDNPQPAQSSGNSTNLVVLVGEFGDGPLGVLTQVTTGDIGQQGAMFGGFGFSYNGSPQGYNPCARQRKVDGATQPEYWNGNGFIATTQHRFGALAVMRVDTSVGSVQFTAEAYLLGTSYYAVSLTSGQHLDVQVGTISAGLSAATVCTFTGTAASITSGAGSYPTSFVAGDYLTFSVDGNAYTAYFLTSDSTQTQVIARLNLAAGAPVFSQGSSTHTVFTGLIAGTADSIQIIAGSANALTATGFTVGGSATAGGGNVPNINQVTAVAANTVIAAAISGVTVSLSSTGQWTLTNGITPGTGTLAIAATSTVTAFGFAVAQTASSIPTQPGTIQAGTVVATSGGAQWVTMQTISTSAGNAGPYTVSVRPATDDGSGLSSAVDTLVKLPNQIPGGQWAVLNPTPITAALSEAAIDAAYVNAINATNALNGVGEQCNVIVSARQSNVIRQALNVNAPLASESCQGRTTCVSPPLGTTTRNMAMSSSSAPGVGVTSSERTDYCYPGVSLVIPSIATLGTAGGAGFTATGQIDVHFDTWVASVLSQLAPEQNPGQLTGYLDAIVSLEQNNPDVQALQMQDYINFKANGIMAPRISEGNVFIESGVTSVNPLTFPGMKTVNRRRMADFIEDSLASVESVNVKLLGTVQARAQVIGMIVSFLSGLRSTSNPSAQRINGFSLDGKSGNTVESLAAGLNVILVNVQTIPSMDNIVLNCTIGTTVTLTAS